MLIVQVRQAQAGVREHLSDLDLVWAMEEKERGAGRAYDPVVAVIKPAVQVAPLPAAQLLRRLPQVTGRVGNVVTGQCGDPAASCAWYACDRASRALWRASRA